MDIMVEIYIETTVEATMDFIMSDWKAEDWPILNQSRAVSDS